MFRRRRVLLGSWLIAVLLFGLLLYVFVRIERWVMPSLKEVAENKVYNIANEMIFQAVQDQVIPQISYQDLFHFRQDGPVVFIQPDVARLNQLTAASALTITRSLNELAKQEISIPLGLALGYRLFAASGPSFPVKVWPVGGVKAKITSKFESAGINQTRHVVNLELEVKIKVAVPLMTSEVNVSMVSPVAEGIIVGQVPPTYLNFGK
ncbi:MAG: sporulation protein YunB [Firmicutes bacterium]|nr:sporulation protein YunB [Bacillota bacterium]MCL5038578.1 sporulation protein YunB [Bacillota bacterium]